MDTLSLVSKYLSGMEDILHDGDYMESRKLTVEKKEPSVLFRRDFLVTSKSRVDFGIGEMHIDLTMLEEMKEIDAMLDTAIC
nr:hypothetical protein [Tanacetum cinerariifolium]